MWARSDTNDYVIASELRFKVGDKVQANVGEFVNGIVTGQWECAVFTVFSWRMGIEGIVGHLKILMPTLGLVNESYL